MSILLNQCQTIWLKDVDEQSDIKFEISSSTIDSKNIKKVFRTRFYSFKNDDLKESSSFDPIPTLSKQAVSRMNSFSIS